jgi:branched-chain amino acid aminotransferase
MTEDLITFPVNKTEASRLNEVDFENLKFGKVFSDHMFVMDYTEGKWQNPRIEAFGKFEVTPAMSVFHYGQAIFEGMKAFYVDEQSFNIFRPEVHHDRLINSAERLCMPYPEKEVFLSALRELVKLDFKWIPKKQGTALYLRPFIIATDDVIAARASESYRFFIITSPVGAYYAEGFNPVKLITAQKYVRAVEGGTGFAKAAGNYAASFLPAQKAQKMGFTQVLWLDAKDHVYVEEVGTMNIHFIIDGKLITPKLTGSILPGVTRRSVIQLAKEWGMEVEERMISIDEVLSSHEEGRLEEVFGSGTAAVISPVGTIEHNGKQITITEGKVGPVAAKFFKAITDIQYGRVEDEHNWILNVNIRD